MDRLRKTLLALGAALLAGTLVATTAFAWPGGIEGRPRQLGAPDDKAGYYIWHDEDGFHLRTTGPGPRHRFRGTLTTNGEFAGVQLVRLEGDDGFVVRNGGQTLDIRFETWDQVDGVDLRIEGGDRLRFALELDGRRAPVDRIFLGEDGSHPERNPFTIRR